ncbi:MAG: hypothetical protein A3F75_07725 [Betaproteobacteria bacterium RIFCSPLOWO2_12_FULL_64_23]|nr:MAG: hypothetical protein A3F75_07725 [Betaproteobacteria bacterium RIFCSPLOWO2_12_FULL_64_23]
MTRCAGKLRETGKGHRAAHDTPLGYLTYTVSGVLAARSLIEGSNYDALWQRELGPALGAGVVNRALYDAFGRRGYSWLLRRQERAGDTRQFLFRLYRSTWAKSLLLPWARRRYRSKRHDASCDHVDCTCVWCRCGGEYA